MREELSLLIRSRWETYSSSVCGSVEWTAHQMKTRGAGRRMSADGRANYRLRKKGGYSVQGLFNSTQQKIKWLFSLCTRGKTRVCVAEDGFRYTFAFSKSPRFPLNILYFSSGGFAAWSKNVAKEVSWPRDTLTGDVLCCGFGNLTRFFCILTTMWDLPPFVSTRTPRTLSRMPYIWIHINE